MPVELAGPENSCLKDTLDNAINVDQSPPGSKEIEENLSKMKDGKCEGTDTVKMEQLKYGRQSVKLLVWLKSKMSGIFKKGL